MGEDKKIDESTKQESMFTSFRSGFRSWLRLKLCPKRLLRSISVCMKRRKAIAFI